MHPYLGEIGGRGFSSTPLAFSRLSYHGYKQISSRPNNDTLNEERTQGVKDSLVCSFDACWKCCKGEVEVELNTNAC